MMSIDMSIAILNIHNEDHSWITLEFNNIKARKLLKSAYLSEKYKSYKFFKKVFSPFLLQQ